MISIIILGCKYKTTLLGGGHSFTAALHSHLSRVLVFILSPGALSALSTQLLKTA